MTKKILEKASWWYQIQPQVQVHSHICERLFVSQSQSPTIQCKYNWQRVLTERRLHYSHKISLAEGISFKERTMQD